MFVRLIGRFLFDLAEKGLAAGKEKKSTLEVLEVLEV